MVVPAELATLIDVYLPPPARHADPAGVSSGTDGSGRRAHVGAEGTIGAPGDGSVAAGPGATAPAGPSPRGSDGGGVPSAPASVGAAGSTRAGRALGAALHLRTGGFLAEAVAQAGRAVLAALGDVLARHGVPVPPDAQVPMTVRSQLVPAGRLARPLADRALSALSWSQGFDAAAGGVATELAEELLGEVRGIVEELARV
jgi:hypothetical protein